MQDIRIAHTILLEEGCHTEAECSGAGKYCDLAERSYRGKEEKRYTIFRVDFFLAVFLCTCLLG